MRRWRGEVVVDVQEAVAAARLRHGVDLVLGERCVGGEVGAHFACLDGEPVVVKSSSSPASARRWAVAVDRVERLRLAGFPVPRYWPPLALPGGALVVQAVMPGVAHDDDVDPLLLDTVMELNRRQDGLGDAGGWHELMVRSLTEGFDGWREHGPLGRHSRAGARLLAQVARGGPCRAAAAGGRRGPHRLPSPQPAAHRPRRAGGDRLGGRCRR